MKHSPELLKQRLYSRRVINGSCWNWTGGGEALGYGKMLANGKIRRVHEISYWVFNGSCKNNIRNPIDHLCNNRRCFNPLHLKIVSARENLLRGKGYSAIAARKTLCPSGHPLTEATYVRKSGPNTGEKFRHCLICKKAQHKKWQQSEKGSAHNARRRQMS